MDTRRSSWPWRKKTISTTSSSSQRKISQYLFTHNASFDANFSDNGGGSDRSYSVHTNKHEQEAPDQGALKTTLQSISVKDQQIEEDKVRNLTEKLNITLAELRIKQESFGQHSKVAEEALTGWERSEAEVASLNRELEGLAKQKAMADARVSQLDDALKECMKQVRQVREEQQQKVSEAINHKTQEWRKIRAELEARQSEMAHKLMESNAQNSVMNKSLQERGKAMVELREAKAKAETEVKLLQVKVESMEKAISASKYELHVLKKELHLCVEEREANQKAMEASHRQHVEDARKMARLESDCNRLRALVKKKINSAAGLCNPNSPASVAQIMKAEAADIFYYSGSSASSSSSARKTGAFDHNSTRPWRRRSYASDQGITNLHHLQGETVIETVKDSNSNSDIVAMSERLMAMEEETRKLQETLAKRNAELDSARQNMPTSVGSMIHGNFEEQSVLTPNNDHLPGRMEISSPALTMNPSKQGGISDHDRGLPQCAETISISSEKLHDDDELSCADSSGANSDGAQISLPSVPSRSEKDTQRQKEVVLAMEIQISEDGAKDICHDTDDMFDIDHHIIIERKHRLLTDQDLRALQTNLAEIRLETKLQSANLLCKDALSKIASLDCNEKAHEFVDPDAPERRISDSRDIVNEAHGMMVKLDAILDELRIAVASCSGDNSGEEDDHTAAKYSSNPSLIEPDHGDGDRNIIKLKHSEEVQLSDKLREAKDEMEKEIANVKAELTLRKEELAEAKRVIMEFEAQLLEVKSRSTEEKLAQRQEDEKSLRTLEVELDRWKRVASEEKTRRTEAEEGLRKAEVEVSKLQKAIATLTVDLTEQRKEYQEGCEALSQKLQGFLQDGGVEDRNSCRHESMEHPRVRKDREVVAAKGKLAECQRTILMLEKQLTSLGNNNSTKNTLIKESNVVSNNNNTQEGSIINKISSNNGNHMVHNNPHVINNNHQWLHRHPQLVVDQLDNQYNNYNSINPHLINHQRPLRVHSDHIGYRGMINENNNKNNNQYSVADFLLMDEDHQLMDHPAPPLMPDYHQMNHVRSNSTVHEHITYHNINQVNSTNYTHSHNHDRRSSSLQLRMINADPNPNPKTNSKPNPNNLQRSSIASSQTTECNPGFGSRFFSRSNTRK